MNVCFVLDRTATFKSPDELSLSLIRHGPGAELSRQTANCGAINKLTIIDYKGCHSTVHTRTTIFMFDPIGTFYLLIFSVVSFFVVVA